jgi:hypothetical protein
MNDLSRANQAVLHDWIAEQPVAIRFYRPGSHEATSDSILGDYIGRIETISQRVYGIEMPMQRVGAGTIDTIGLVIDAVIPDVGRGDLIDATVVYEEDAPAVIEHYRVVMATRYTYKTDFTIERRD